MRGRGVPLLSEEGRGEGVDIPRRARAGFESRASEQLIHTPDPPPRRSSRPAGRRRKDVYAVLHPASQAAVFRDAPRGEHVPTAGRGGLAPPPECSGASGRGVQAPQGEARRAGGPSGFEARGRGDGPSADASACVNAPDRAIKAAAMKKQPPERVLGTPRQRV